MFCLRATYLPAFAITNLAEEPPRRFGSATNSYGIPPIIESLRKCSMNPLKAAVGRAGVCSISFSLGANTAVTPPSERDSTSGCVDCIGPLVGVPRPTSPMSGVGSAVCKIRLTRLLSFAASFSNESKSISSLKLLMACWCGGYMRPADACSAS